MHRFKSYILRSCRVGSTGTALVLKTSIPKGYGSSILSHGVLSELHFHWKVNIEKFEKSFRMKWLLFYVGIKGGGR